MMNHLLAGALALVLFCAPLSAQSSFGTISGTVADGTGALIPGVSVTATNVGTNVATIAVSNDTGTYTIQALLPGTSRRYRTPGILSENSERRPG